MVLKQENYNQILDLIKTGLIDKALALTRSFLKNNKEDLSLNKIQAFIYGQKEEYELALEILERLKKIYPKDFDIANNIGNYALKLENIDLAFANIAIAKKIKPESPVPYKNAADCFMLLRNFKSAEIEINQCIHLNESLYQQYAYYIEAILLKAEVLIANHQREQAKIFLKKYLDFEFNSEICLELCDIDPDFVSEKNILHVKELIKNSAFSSHLNKFSTLSPLLFILGKYYEKRDPISSDTYYVKANQEVSKIQRMHVFAYQKKFSEIMKKYEEIKNINISNFDYGGEAVFVVGLPRSGTTLLESILNANNQVFAGGELRAFQRFYNQYSDSLTPNITDRLERLGQNYLNCVSSIKGDYEFIIDKLPLNFSVIGFIAKSLPQSKIFLVLRNPWDVAKSQFRQRYVQNVPFSSSFFNIGVYIANFEAIINFWRSFSEIDQRIYTIKYENLVRDTQKEQEKIYAYCKITEPYQENLRKKHFAKTASMNQVQNTIHHNSSKNSAFEHLKPEFFDAYYAQREFWINKGIKFNDIYFGYL